jgi:YesN/AraC family two-component response regulator
MKTRLLFVDDEPNVLQGLRRMLRPLRNEWDMVFAENAQDALTRLARESFDVLVTDIMMPEKDGLEIIMEMRRRFPAVKIIAVSGGGRMGNLYFLDIAAKLGALHALQKPFGRQEIINAVREVMQSTD